MYGKNSWGDFGGLYHEVITKGFELSLRIELTVEICADRTVNVWTNVKTYAATEPAIVDPSRRIVS